MTLTTTYFGNVAWYWELVHAKQPVYIEACENYVKQTMRNRCVIATANGTQTLSVPVESARSAEQKGAMTIRDVRISDHNNWRHQHWQALSSAYGSSPFFEFYADDIAPFFEKKWDFLFDYNMEIMHKMCELIDISPDIRLTETYDSSPVSPSASSTPYYQVFKSRHGFIPNLSILDLLFNMGPESLVWLMKN